MPVSGRQDENCIVVKKLLFLGKSKISRTTYFADLH